MAQELIRQGSLTIGTDPVLVSEEQIGPQRSVIFLSNQSAGGQIISVSWELTPVANEGIVLGVGGFIQDSIDSGYKPNNKRIFAISSAAGGTLAYHERVLQ